MAGKRLKMAADVAPDGGSKPTLRAMQKENTRKEIRNAARALFSTLGWSATQVDQIASAARVSRATFYLHFKDKEDVLREIALDYMPSALAVMRRLKGPSPGHKDLMAWLREWVKLVKSERAATIIFTELAQGDAGLPGYIQKIVDEIVDVLAETFESFAAVKRPGPLQLEAKIRTEMLIMQTTKICRQIVRIGDREYADVALSILATMFHDFLTDARFRRDA
jgi:AcrR family transcriptional regulator